MSAVSDDVYYGSTCLPLAKRLYSHKQDCQRYKKGKRNYVASFKVLEHGFDSAQIVLVEEYPCSNKMELLKRERYYIENNTCVNKYIPCRTEEERKALASNYNKNYRTANEISVKQQKLKYRMINRDKINEKQREYGKVIVICACGTRIRRDDLHKHRKSVKHKSFETLQGLQRIQDGFTKNTINMNKRIKEFFAQYKI